MGYSINPHKLEAMVNYIDEFSKLNGFSPSVREITRALQISSTSVTDYALTRLESQGRIIRNRFKARNIRITDLNGLGVKQSRISLPLDDTIYIISKLKGLTEEATPDFPMSRLKRIVLEMEDQLETQNQ